jgi:hypothetical protein
MRCIRSCHKQLLFSLQVCVCLLIAFCKYRARLLVSWQATMKDSSPRSAHRPGGIVIDHLLNASTGLERDVGLLFSAAVKNAACRSHLARRSVASALRSMLDAPESTLGRAPFAKVQVPGPVRDGQAGMAGAGHVGQDRAQTSSSRFVTPYSIRTGNTYEGSASFEV